MNSHYICAEENGKIKLGTKETGAPFGHIVSLLVEEMKIEKPNLKRILLSFNLNMNGAGKIKKLTNYIYQGDDHYKGIMRYFDTLKREGMITENFIERVKDEFKGIIPEERVFEKDKTFSTYYFH